MLSLEFGRGHKWRIGGRLDFMMHSVALGRDISASSLFSFFFLLRLHGIVREGRHLYI
jgi:hypothetical protein